MDRKEGMPQDKGVRETVGQKNQQCMVQPIVNKGRPSRRKAVRKIIGGKNREL